MPRGKPKTPINMRIAGHLVDFVTEYATNRGTDRTGLTESLYEALAEGRLYVQPRPGPNPFPANNPLFPEPVSEE